MVKRNKRGTANALLVAAFFMYVPAALAQTVAISQCQGQCPVYDSASAQRNAQVVIHHVYAAGLNGQTGLADWVAYRMTSDAVGVASLLTRSWQPDRLVDSNRDLEIMESTAAQISLASISQRDNPYAGVNPPSPKAEDRARLAPITSFANTPYWSDLNNLSNMVPMPAALRLGAWLRLEQALNSLVTKSGELYVVTGPLFLITESLSSTSASNSFTPAAYYKLVVAEEGFAAFVFNENLQQHVSYCDQQSPLEQIEKMSGLTLLPDDQYFESPALLEQLGCNH
ncbi:MAG: DNA/RNA non-specific endonuclease [Pseudohongiellaceae bacterium]